MTLFCLASVIAAFIAGAIVATLYSDEQVRRHVAAAANVAYGYLMERATLLEKQAKMQTEETPRMMRIAVSSHLKSLAYSVRREIVVKHAKVEAEMHAQEKRKAAVGRITDTARKKL